MLCRKGQPGRRDGEDKEGAGLQTKLEFLPLHSSPPAGGAVASNSVVYLETCDGPCGNQDGDDEK